jgi:hypothetical protein
MDIGEFYDGDPRRRPSEEVAYGDGWTSETDPHATYRCQWVRDTGELYTVREPHPGGLLARYLDELDLDQANASELVVAVLLTEPDRERVEAMLGGWEEAMPATDSLRWLHARVGVGEPLG